MTVPRIVLDTNVLVAGLRSNRGPAYRMLSLLGEEKFDVCLSVPLLFEYEDVLAREHIAIPASSAEDVLDYICHIAVRQNIHYLWRPYLRDAKDDLVLEVAVASQSNAIITYNTKDFEAIAKFGLRALRPAELLVELGVNP